MKRVVIFAGALALLIIGGSAAFLHFTSGAPLIYRTQPIRAVVIHANTKEPIQGVVVVAVWQLTGPFGGHGRVLYEYETVTDTAGVLYIPPMPRRLRPFAQWLDYRDPAILFYKPGYLASELDNRDARMLPTGSGTRRRETYSVRSSVWNGRTIVLGRAQDASDQVRSFVLARERADRLAPERFPRLWHALKSGYDRLPEDAQTKTGFGDPQWFIQRFPKGRKQ